MYWKREPLAGVVNATRNLLVPGMSDVAIQGFFLMNRDASGVSEDTGLTISEVFNLIEFMKTCTVEQADNAGDWKQEGF